MKLKLATVYANGELCLKVLGYGGNSDSSKEGGVCQHVQETTQVEHGGPGEGSCHSALWGGQHERPGENP